MWDIIGQLLTPAALLLASWVVSRLKQPKDFERAAEIKIIAEAAARLVVIEYPGDKWADLLRRVIQTIGASVPTGNPTVISRAAAAALVEAGVTKPS